jgi:hypothetical protein
MALRGKHAVLAGIYTLSAGFVATARADVIYVRASATGANTGTSWADAYVSLHSALAAAQGGDQIWITEGVYTPAGPSNPSMSFVLPANVTIYGGFAGTETSPEQRNLGLHQTALSGQLDIFQHYSYHVLRADSASVNTVLDGLEIRDGYANGGTADRTGGGLLMVGGSLTFRGCRFTNNRAAAGAAALHGGDGGGVHASLSAQLSFVGCVFQSNRAGGGKRGDFGTPGPGGNGGSGGAVFAENATLSFSNCYFGGENRAGNGGAGGSGFSAGVGGSGGAIRARGGVISITDCAFYINYSGSGACDGMQPSAQTRAGYGGAVFLDSIASAVSITQCQFGSNRCGDGREGHGGALYFTNVPSLSLVDCYFENNWAARGDPVGGDGGALFASATDLSIVRGTFSNNHAGNGLAACGQHSVHGGNGGAVAASDGPLVLQDCVFSGNFAGTGTSDPVDGNGGSGGAVMVGRGPFAPPGIPASVSVRSCEFQNNQAAATTNAGQGGHGGALQVAQAEEVELVYVFAVGNQAGGGGSTPGAGGNGGAIHIAQASAVTITNSLAVGNQAGDGGSPGVGGALHLAADATISNATIVGNATTSPSGGGGISLDAAGTIRNCIVWQNLAGGGTVEMQQISGFDGDDSIDYSCVQGLSGAFGGVGNTGADPLFVNPSAGNYHLGHGSSCIDSGRNASVPPAIALDISGNPRFYDDPATPDTGAGTAPIVDMGAMEFGACPADLDGDRDVDLPELAQLLSEFGSHGTNLTSDLDHDDDVDLADVTIMLASFGVPCP